MSVTYSYTGTFNVGRLSDELITATVSLITIRGSTTAIDIVCNDGQAQAPVTTVVNAHSGAASPTYPALTGDTTTFVRADGTLAAPSGAAPDPATTVTSETSFGVSSAVGTGTKYARDDHTHGSPTNPVPAHVALSDPHTQYQQEVEKDAASGYAGVDAAGAVLRALALRETSGPTNLVVGAVADGEIHTA